MGKKIIYKKNRKRKKIYRKRKYGMEQKKCDKNRKKKMIYAWNLNEI